MSDVSDSAIEGFLCSHGSFEKLPALVDGDSIDEWMVRAFLGRGGSAEVYRAENGTTGIFAALKVFCKTDDRTRERFRREARLLAENRIAAFPKFYGAGCATGRFYIAEELLEPMTFPRTDAEVAQFILSVAAGVEELHRRGFVHRDIKPRNVMVRPVTGESVLVDMGLAKESEGEAIANDTLSVVDGRAVGVGTPGFSAPEQFAGGKIGPATDIHALGMLANACFDGKPPRAWTTIIRRSTSSIPEQRYATVQEFARAIRHRHAVRWLWAITAVIFLFFAFFALHFWGQSPRVWGLSPYEDTHERPREQFPDWDSPSNVGDRPQSADGDRPSQLSNGDSPSQVSDGDRPLTQKELAEEIFNLTYDMFYSDNTNIDRKAAIELMRKGISPVY